MSNNEDGIIILSDSDSSSNEWVEPFYSDNDSESNIEETIIQAINKPDYSSFSLQELQELCSNYGLRKLTKLKMVEELNLIWERKYNPQSVLNLFNESNYISINDTGDNNKRLELTKEVELSLFNFLRNDKELYDKLVRFEPIDLDTVFDKYTNSALGLNEVKINKKILIEFLDKKGILFGHLASKRNRKLKSGDIGIKRVKTS